MGLRYTTTPKTKDTIDSIWHLMKVILNSLDFNTVVQSIVDSVLVELGYLRLGYQIVVLALIDEDSNTLRRISISKTKKAQKALDITPVPFKDIVIPLSSKNNACIKAIRKNKPVIVKKWDKLLVPPYTKEDALKVQSSLGIKTSMVYPVSTQGEPRGILIFSMDKETKKVTSEEKDLISSFTDLVGLAVQNAKLYSRVEESRREVEKVNRKLKEMDKQKDEFISMAAHELRAPMTAIKGYTSMILEGDAGPITDKMSEYLTDTMMVNARLIRLVNNMLNVGRIEEGRMVYHTEVCRLRDSVDQVFASFKFEAKKKNLGFELVVPEDIKDTVEVDSDKVTEVISNFVSNAIKYTDEGKVVVKMSQPDPKTVRVEVIDTGPGISKNEQKHLFEKFYRVESKVGKTIGTGLGLYIAKLLVEKFDGKIGIDSDVNMGSNFWFEIPTTDKPLTTEEENNS